MATGTPYTSLPLPVTSDALEVIKLHIKTLTTIMTDEKDRWGGHFITPYHQVEAIKPKRYQTHILIPPIN